MNAISGQPFDKGEPNMSAPSVSIQDLFIEWKALTESIKTLPDDSGDEYNFKERSGHPVSAIDKIVDMLADRRDEIEEQLAKTPALTHEDTSRKLAILGYHANDYILTLEDTPLLKSAIADAQADIPAGGIPIA